MFRSLACYIIFRSHPSKLPARCRKMVIVDGSRALWNHVNANPLYNRCMKGVDFWHATEYLAKAAEAAYGEETYDGQGWFRKWKELTLLLHVLFLQILHRLPMQVKLLGDIPNARGTAPAPHVEDETLGVERVVGQKGKLLLLHLAAAPALDAAHLQIEVDAKRAAREIAYPPALPVVDTRRDTTTGAACRFFPRRSRVTTRAWGSPKTPSRRRQGRKLGKRYASSRDLERGIGKTYQNSRGPEIAGDRANIGREARHPTIFTHSETRRPQNYLNLNNQTSL